MKTRKYIVSGFSLAGVSPDPQFESFTAALQYYRDQSKIPSYISGKPPRGSITEIVIWSRDVTPKDN